MTASMPAGHQRPSAASTRDAVYATIAGFLGWALDAFDFFLVVLSLPYIAATYFPNLPETQRVERIALAGVVTLGFRPVGAFLFGLLADRYGRRLPLMLDLVFYSIIEVLTGFAPNYTTFMILRALFGIGMGGEWGVGATLVMEKVPPRYRGILSGLLQEGYAFGYLLAAVAFSVVFPRWGWRSLFWIGGVPAILAIFVRLGVRESEVWAKTKAESWSHLGTAILSHWKIMLYLILLMAMLNLASHGTQDLYPTFLKHDWNLSPRAVSVLTIISMIGAIVGGIAFGLLSDHWGRKRSMILAFILAILCIPIWAFTRPMLPLAVGAFLIQFMVQGAWGVIPAHISELSPDQVRGFLPGFGYQCGAAIAGFGPWFESLIANQFKNAGIAFPYGKAMAVCAVAIFAIAAVVTALGWERHGTRFGEETPPSRGFEVLPPATAQ